MIRIVVDTELRRKLHDFAQDIELCDDAGRILGRIVVTQEPSANGFEEPPISEEELDRRMQEPEYTTAEVLAFLEKL